MFRRHSRIIAAVVVCFFTWGIGLTEDNDDTLDTAKLRGSNLLGKVLMDVLEKLKETFEQSRS